ncbi:MAG: endonuclease/exonuclease/phosphatase family protein [Hyphomonadaceae bacterium]|nr:endonuclease/exonuclease/phosphatase family protein [Hyphomonadaceae bacterium]
MRKWLVGLGVAATLIALWLGAFMMANASPVAQLRDIEADLRGPTRPAPDTIEVLVWNLGYGGLGAGSDFVADGGVHYFPPSRTAVRENVSAIAERIRSEAARTDVFVFQEMAGSGPVNYWVDLRAQVDRALAGRQRLFFADFKTRLMPWPLRMEHGQAIYSSFAIADPDVVALPAEDASIFGVKRRYAALVSRLQIDGRTQGWTIVSLHLAAFDADAVVRTRQLRELLAWAQREYERGQHVILAGDWNFQIAETNFPHTTEDRFLFWLFPFPQDALPEGWRIAADATVPSVRTNHQPYVPGENYVTTIDGFIVSPNVEVESVAGIDLGFAHSDHQPVRLRARAR